nr:hypothetical protein CFP56_26733 [Quercus suber]
MLNKPQLSNPGRGINIFRPLEKGFNFSYMRENLATLATPTSESIIKFWWVLKLLKRPNHLFCSAQDTASNTTQFYCQNKL